LNLKSEIEMGSVPAPGAVFRALAENNERNKKVPVRPGILVSQTAGREARPATPEAGVLPSSGFQVESFQLLKRSADGGSSRSVIADKGFPDIFFLL
jgi:hypothetical protein